MNNINQILLELANDPSRIAKEVKLREHHDNELLKRVIVMTLDPYLNFYIKKIPDVSVPVVGAEVNDLSWALDQLGLLSNRTFTGHAGIKHLSMILASISEDDAEVITKIIRRDLRCGVSTSTVNKIWNKLVPEYACLLCSPYDEKTIKKIKWSAYVQLKADGLRFNAIIENSHCDFYSRKGQLIDMQDDQLASEFIRLANGENLVFDGEMLAYKNGVLLDRKTGNGIANKAIKGTINNADSELLCGMIWDCIPLEDFKNGKCPIPYQDRYTKLKTSLDSLYTDEELLMNVLTHGITKKIALIETHEVSSFEDAQVIFNKYLSDGMEGAIIKNKLSLWSDTRSQEQIKLKAEKTCELRVVGWNYGTVGTKNEHRLGSLMCKSEDGKVVVNISGFTDDERDSITPENSINKIVSVLYNERITKKDGGVDSLFLPRIIEFREDKDVADFSSTIK